LRVSPFGWGGKIEAAGGQTTTSGSLARISLRLGRIWQRPPEVKQRPPARLRVSPFGWGGFGKGRRRSNNDLRLACACLPSVGADLAKAAGGQTTTSGSLARISLRLGRMISAPTVVGKHSSALMDCAQRTERASPLPTRRPAICREQACLFRLSQPKYAPSSLQKIPPAPRILHGPGGLFSYAPVLTAFSAILVKIIRPADVCSTVVTTTATVSPT